MKLTFPCFDSTESKYVKICLQSKWITQGPFVEKFEKSFSERHKIKYAIATTSCPAALHMAMIALGIGPGDEVIVPAFTWVTSAHCVEYVGARPVFADINLDSYNIDLEEIARKITKRTKAIIVVHLFGLAAQMDKIGEIAKKHGLYIVEDAACAIGSNFNGKPVGGFGDIGCFSFHPRKVITTGEGGMLSTKNRKLMLKLCSLRNHGAKEPTGKQKVLPYSVGVFDSLGYNFRLSDIVAAVGVAQMEKLDKLLAERRECAERYTKMLSGIEEIFVPVVNAGAKCGHTYQSYVIRLINSGEKRRNRIMDMLSESNIQTRLGTIAVHSTKYYTKKYGTNCGLCPNATIAQNTTITLPLYPGMRARDQEFVSTKLKEAIRVTA